MSRFCFCNCPAGFSADPERHAPDCPGRTGAGKTRTPVPATTAAAQPVNSGVDFGIDGRSVRISQEAYSIFLAREAAGREKIAALQQLLNAADERIDELERGRGEPVMKLEAERLWGGHGEYAVSFVKAGWLDECRRTGGEFLLYTAAPAPVAVDLPVDPERERLMEIVQQYPNVDPLDTTPQFEQSASNPSPFKVSRYFDEVFRRGLATASAASLRARPTPQARALVIDSRGCESSASSYRAIPSAAYIPMNISVLPARDSLTCTSI
ncbi:hypothetical protein JET67_22245 [Pseudomonas palleroniana]|nr:hypothetical protein [Pseudomonas palleroniana]